MSSVEIDDRREEFRWIPAVEILRSVIAHIPEKNIAGIRKIILFDQDYKKDRGVTVGARYVPVSGAKTADVEIFFQWYSSLDKNLVKNKVYLTYTLSSSLIHELFHHSTNLLKINRKQSDEKDEARAEDFGDKGAKYIVNKIYPRDAYQQEYEEIYRIQSANS